MSATAPRAVIVGSGLAGLSCALELARGGWEAQVLTPGSAGRDGATHRVHALAPWILLTAPRLRGDSPEAFLADLIDRGEGRVREEPARAFAKGAHRAAEEICELLDLEAISPDPLLLAGDSHPRGLRCRPRRSGPVLAALVERCRAAGVGISEGTLAVGLLTGSRGEACGVAVHSRSSATLAEIPCHAVVLACGGPGSVFPTSTAPRWCRGSGLAIGAAAGALLHAPHLTQALPVTATPPLYFPGSSALLEGQIEVDGRRLGARSDLDALTRLIARAVTAGRSVRLLLGADGATVVPARIARGATCRREGGVALTVAVHHGIGGVAIDACGRTSLAGLYACGEAAGGIQGRHRTMGTGLIEARIFGVAAARAILHDENRLRSAGPGERRHLCALPASAAGLEERLDALMGPLAAERPRDGLVAAAAELAPWPLGRAGDRRSWLVCLRRAAAQVIIEAELAAIGGRDAEVLRDRC